MSNFLVIDWDFFFPNPFEGGDFKAAGGKTWLYDWNHIENDFHIGPSLWTTRLHSFVMNGLALPEVVAPEGGWHAWWDRFDIAEDALLSVCDSNGFAGNVRDGDGEPFESVWLYDAHHDSGYQTDSWPRQSKHFSCEDWMLVHADHGSQLHVRYPQWKVYAMTAEPEPLLAVDRQFDDGSNPPVDFSHVLLCRSGAWVPPWCDSQFLKSADAFPGFWHQVDNVELLRDFDVEHYTTQAMELAKAMNLRVADRGV